jgi:hypothetical protein
LHTTNRTRNRVFEGIQTFSGQNGRHHRVPFNIGAESAWPVRPARLAITAVIGCSHTTLTRSRLFQTAKALASTKGRRHTGWKTAAGDIEAVAKDDDD